MRIEFNNSNEAQRQMDIVLNRFMMGEHLSALSCLPDGVSPSSFNRIYKWLKDGTYTKGGKRYAFREYWSDTDGSGGKKRGAYKLRVLIGTRDEFNNVIPIHQMELVI